MARLPHFLIGGLLAFGALSTTPAQAQLNVNIIRPSWGPAAPASVQYYYLPEVGSYYDLRGQQYVVRREGRWQRLKQVNGYNPASWHPVVIDYVGDQPWSRHEEYRRRYPANLPPGQVKRLKDGKGLPPGQAKKYAGKNNRDSDQGYGRDYDDTRGPKNNGKGNNKGRN